MFSSGNDISIFMTGELGEILDTLDRAVTKGVYNFISSVTNSKKPTIVLVRGKCIGMTFTMSSNADFIYCTSNASFQTPFMSSF